MFSWQDPDADGPPPPVLFDYDLPDSLLRAREAALLTLRPLLTAHGRTFGDLQVHASRLLVEAAEPLAISELQRRGAISDAQSRVLAEGLVAHGYAEWAAPERAGNNKLRRRLAARDIARRQINQIAREAERGGASWAALAARPGPARFNEAMRKRLFALLIRLSRACAREPILDGANQPDPAGEDRVFGLTLRLRLARIGLLHRMKPSLKKYDFTELQWRILRIVASQPGIGWSTGALFRRACCRFCSPHIPRALFYLSQRGLVQKHAEGERPKQWRLASGRRRQMRWKAEISRNGLDIVGMVEARLMRDCADLFERLSGAEVRELGRLLFRLTTALLWRDGVAEEDQDTHPFAEEYRRFDAIVAASARAENFRRKIYREADVPVPTKKIFHWWE